MIKNFLCQLFDAFIFFTLHYHPLVLLVTINYQANMNSPKCKCGVFAHLLFLALFTLTISMDKAPLRLETGQLALYRPWTDQQNLQESAYPLPIYTLPGQKAVIGIKAMEIEEPESMILESTNQIQIWISQTERKLSCVLRQINLGLLKLEVSYLKLNPYELSFLQLEKHLELQIHSQKNKDIRESKIVFVWSQQANKIDENQLNLQKKLIQSKIRCLPMLTGFTLKKGDFDQISLSLDVERINNTHLTFKNNFRGIQSLTFNLIAFREINLFENLISFEFQNLPYEKQGDLRNINDQNLSNNILLLSSFDQKIKGNIKSLQNQKMIQINKLVNLTLWKVSCPYGQYWGVSLNKCVPICRNNILENDKVCLTYSTNGESQSSEDEQLEEAYENGLVEITERTHPQRFLSCKASCRRIANCLSCRINYYFCKAYCTSCTNGYYIGSLGASCVLCPSTCTTCYSYIYNSKTYVSCKTCKNNLTLILTNPATCGCLSTQYFATNYCYNCTTGCATCTSNTTCTSCKAGYYFVSPSCLACMPVCKTCTSITSCTSCDASKGFILNSNNICECPSPTLLNPTTKSCQSCQTIIPNCLACNYSTTYSSSTPVPVICTTPALGYYLVSGLPVACGSFCNVCTSPTTCTDCYLTFINGSLCSCPTTPTLQYPTNSTPSVCDTCSNIIPGCSSCSFTTTTLCTSCISNYYPKTTPYPTTGCIACPIYCTTCTSSTFCTNCGAGMLNPPVSGQCFCTLPNYLDPVSLTCVACNLAIANCLTCASTIPTTCLTSVSGTYISADKTQVIACPLNCATCTITGCTSPSPGYTLTGSTITCDTTCTGCISGPTLHCTLCLAGPTCGGCQSGYYLSSTTTCSSCPTYCIQCTNTGTCLSCNATFNLTTSLQCTCNATIDFYLNSITNQCQTCSSVIIGCKTCLSTTPTSCSVCADGYFLSSPTTCTVCAFPCKTCSGTANNNCLSCLAKYVLTSSPATNECTCQTSPYLWVSNVTQNCETCSTIVPNCLTCITMGSSPSYTGCSVCADPYYADISGDCILCPVTCTSCTGINACSACANNLVIYSPSIGDCVPATLTDSTLTYYGPTNSAISCLLLLSNCQTCTPSPLTCTLCATGTFLNGTICQNCDPSCATCDSTGCTSPCPSGLTPNGTACECTGTCLICQSAIADCLTCTITGSTVSSCLSCLNGFYLQNGMCYSCSTGCAICTSSTVCTLCKQTFTLSGGSCSCDATLDLYPNGETCQLCSDIVYECLACSATGSNTTCIKCDDGFFLTSSGTCTPCSSSCATCTSATLCESCPSGYTLLTNYTCTCGTACQTCNVSQPNCVSCVLNVLGTFGQCNSCAVGYYLSPTYTCLACPSAYNCTTCGQFGYCTSCSLSLQNINGVCKCNLDKGMFLDTVTSLCQSCTIQIPNCLTCITNATATTGYSCDVCVKGYYVLNGACQLEKCGDGIISSSEKCDDGNTVPNDGCFNCQVQTDYKCFSQPSLCFMNTPFTISFDSLVVSSTICNQLTINFGISPIEVDYNNANFYDMLMSYAGSSLISKPSKATYKAGIISYSFEYVSQVVGDEVKFFFMPSLLNIASTASIGLYPIFVKMTTSNNSVLLKHYTEDECSKKNSVTAFVQSVQYLSYGALMISALPCKIVGLQLFGVLQLSFFTLGNIDNLNPLLASFTQFSSSNGLNLKVDGKQKTYRRLQQTALTPSRVQTIGYASNFLRNCNLMLIVVYAIMLVAFVLYLLSYLVKKCSPTLFSLSKRIFKEVLLTLILFNCFNFSYSSGLHFAYADHNDSLYALGTLAAITTILIPLLIVFILQCTQEQGFGQYKDKLRQGCLERAYFVITIFYRMGIGYYTATMNENNLSSLIVLALSLFFMLYNLVNLPFQKAYHNYRANICHITQFICLFVGMYYRSLKSTSNVDEVNYIYGPVYLQIVAIAVSLTVSVIVLTYEVYIWIADLRKNCCKKKEQQVQESSIAKIQKETNIKKDNNITCQNFELQSDQDEKLS